jgi:hypothetical protein
MTFKPIPYFGGAVRRTVDDGADIYHESGTGDAPRTPYPRVTRLYVNDTAGSGPAKYHLPDATGLQTGWPILVLIVEGSPTSNGFRLQNYDGSLILNWTAGQFPVTITLGLSDNSTPAGQWTWCAKSATIILPPSIGYVGSFGTGGDIPSLVRKYDTQLNVWSSNPALTFDARNAGSSWDGLRTLVRDDKTIYSYLLAGTTTLENSGGSAQCKDVAFCRVPPPSDGTITFQRDHVCFGSWEMGSYSNIIDRYRSDTNVIYLGTTPAWIDWDWCTASGSTGQGPVGCLVAGYEGTPTPAYSIYTPFFFYAPLFDTSTKVINLPTDNWYRGHLVELLGWHHWLGGTTVEPTVPQWTLGPTAYHLAMDMATASAWVVLPNLVLPCFWHGCMGFSTTEVRSRAYYGMGRANAVDESANPYTYYYDQYTQVSAILRSDVWTNWHHQTSHWSRLS